MGIEGKQGEKGEMGLKGKEGPPGDPGLVGVRVSYFWCCSNLGYLVGSTSGVHKATRLVWVMTYDL